jgi:ATP synthase F1 complex assembly factor 1
MLRTVTRSLFTFPIPKQLNEVARLPLLQQETAVKIRQLWLDQFKDRADVVVGTLARAEYETFRANAIACPMFIVPVMKSEASYFNLVSQFQDGKHCLLTQLDAYRQNPSNASPAMVTTVYEELVAEKGIALMRGDIINRLEITRSDAQKILKFLRHVYINKFELVKRFNKDPRNFDYEDFMQQYRQFSLEHGGVSNSL